MLGETFVCLYFIHKLNTRPVHQFCHQVAVQILDLDVTTYTICSGRVTSALCASSGPPPHMQTAMLPSAEESVSPVH